MSKNNSGQKLSCLILMPQSFSHLGYKRVVTKRILNPVSMIKLATAQEAKILLQDSHLEEEVIGDERLLILI